MHLQTRFTCHCQHIAKFGELRLRVCARYSMTRYQTPCVLFLAAYVIRLWGKVDKARDGVGEWDHLQCSVPSPFHRTRSKGY